LWSGSFFINRPGLLHVNVRDRSGKMHFLSAEVVEQEATFVIVFTDVYSMPPPVRIDNFSEVPINIYQVYMYPLADILLILQNFKNVTEYFSWNFCLL
jgi:vacuolar protein sorting-associated protein 13D